MSTWARLGLNGVRSISWRHTGEVGRRSGAAGRVRRRGVGESLSRGRTRIIEVVRRLPTREAVGHSARGEPNGIEGFNGYAAIGQCDSAMFEEKLEQAGALVVAACLVERTVDVRVIAVPLYRCTIGVLRDERVGVVGSG